MAQLFALEVAVPIDRSEQSTQIRCRLLGHSGNATTDTPPHGGEGCQACITGGLIPSWSDQVKDDAGAPELQVLDTETDQLRAAERAGKAEPTAARVAQR